MTTATPDRPRYPNVTVQLTGQDGNTVSLAGLVARALRRHSLHDEAASFVRQAFECDSHDAFLRLAMSTVNVI